MGIFDYLDIIRKAKNRNLNASKKLQKNSKLPKKPPKSTKKWYPKKIVDQPQTSLLKTLKTPKKN